MNSPSQPDQELAQRLAAPVLDVLIRAGLILALAMLCYRVFAPFLPLMVWALILAVTLYPLHQALASTIGGKQGLAATLLVVVGVVLIVVPTAMLLSSLGDAVQQLVNDVQNNTLTIPAPRPGVEAWPVVGKQIYDVWSKAHADLPALVQSMQPKIGELAKTALGFVASIGGGLLQFLASFIIAGILMAFGQSGSRSSRAIFERLVGTARGSDIGQPVHGDHSCRRPRGDRGGLHPGHHRRRGPAGRRGAVGGCAGGARAGPRHRPGAGAARDRARYRLPLVERRVQHGGGDRLHGPNLAKADFSAKVSQRRQNQFVMLTQGLHKDSCKSGHRTRTEVLPHIIRAVLEGIILPTARLIRAVGHDPIGQECLYAE